MPILEKIMLSESAKLGIWQMKESVEELKNLLQDQQLSLESDTKYTEKRKKEFLSVRCLLQRLWDSIQFPKIQYSDSGRPMLTDSCAISISHTKDFVAVLIDKKLKNIGVDVEKISERANRVKSKFLTCGELSFVKSLSEKEQCEWSTIFWSAKESVFKAMNQNDLGDFQRISLLKESENKLRVFIDNVEQKSFVHFWVKNDFILTIFLF